MVAGSSGQMSPSPIQFCCQGGEKQKEPPGLLASQLMGTAGWMQHCQAIPGMRGKPVHPTCPFSAWPGQHLGAVVVSTVAPDPLKGDVPGETTCNHGQGGSSRKGGWWGKAWLTHPCAGAMTDHAAHISHLVAISKE